MIPRMPDKSVSRELGSHGAGLLKGGARFLFSLSLQRLYLLVG